MIVIEVKRIQIEKNNINRQDMQSWGFDYLFNNINGSAVRNEQEFKK